MYPRRRPPHMQQQPSPMPTPPSPMPRGPKKGPPQSKGPGARGPGGGRQGHYWHCPYHPYHYWYWNEYDDYDWYDYDDYDWYDYEDGDDYSWDDRGAPQHESATKRNNNTAPAPAPKMAECIKAVPLLMYSLFKHVRDAQPTNEHLESMVTKMVSLDSDWYNPLDMSNYDEIVGVDDWKVTQQHLSPSTITPKQLPPQQPPTGE